MMWNYYDNGDIPVEGVECLWDRNFPNNLWWLSLKGNLSTLLDEAEVEGRSGRGKAALHFALHVMPLCQPHFRNSLVTFYGHFQTRCGSR